MTTQEKKEDTKKIYDYDDIVISLENSILPSEKLDETPSMKDGLDRDTENDIRFYGCELIQISGLLLKLPQVAMATGQILLQRFYFSKSMIRHDIEVYAMASIFLAAKIEECPRRLRDIVNVCHHIKQKLQQKPITPMDYFSNQYFNTKNAVIKAERQILKELGFCVHVKHPHKLIITYLQMLEAEKNAALARKAWNYMNDSLRTDVFVRFSPEIIACACIFLAARVVKINLPLRPPWWELFDATYDDIEDISLSVLRLYAKPRRKTSHLEAAISTIKKSIQEKKEAAASQNQSPAGSFTPSHPTSTANTIQATNNTTASSDSTKTSTKSNSPNNEKKRSLTSVVSTKKGERKEGSSNNGHKNHNHVNSRHAVESDSSDSSESDVELPTKKYAQQRRQYEKDKRRSVSSDSDDNRRPQLSKTHRSDSPSEYKRDRTKDYDKRKKDSYKDKGHHRNNDFNSKHNRRKSRSRSPVKRSGRSPSPIKKEKHKEKDRVKSKEKYYDSLDKYSEKRSDKYSHIEKHTKMRR